jgi:hypothetical protein
MSGSSAMREQADVTPTRAQAERIVDGHLREKKPSVTLPLATSPSF